MASCCCGIFAAWPSLHDLSILAFRGPKVVLAFYFIPSSQADRAQHCGFFLGLIDGSHHTCTVEPCRAYLEGGVPEWCCRSSRQPSPMPQQPSPMPPMPPAIAAAAIADAAAAIADAAAAIADAAAAASHRRCRSSHRRSRAAARFAETSLSVTHDLGLNFGQRF